MNWRRQLDAQVNAIIQEQDLYRKFILVRTLDDVFEGYYYYPRPDPSDVHPAIMLLLDYALDYVFQDVEFKKQQEKQALRGIDVYIFSTLNKAVGTCSIGEYVRWDKLVTILPRLPVSVLYYALCLLSYSYDEKYIPLLESYINYPYPRIQEAARQSLGMMKYLQEKRKNR